MVGKKEDKRSNKKLLPLHIFKVITEGKSPYSLVKEKQFSKRQIQYIVDKLKKEGKITNPSYNVWKVTKEVTISTKDTQPHLENKPIRGHAFIWKVKLNRQINWKNRLNFLGIRYSTIGVKSTPRIILNGKKVWFTSKGLIIYEPRSFFAKNSITSKGMAVYELDKTIKEIEKLLELDLKGYKFTTSREHYGIIKNELARQYNKEGKKLYIRDENNSFWMWIDDSLSLGELENNEMLISKKVQDYWNDGKKNNFDLTMTENKRRLQELADNNLKLTKALEEMNNNLIRLSKIVYDIGNKS